MVVGILIAAMITSTMTDAVTGADYLDIYKQNVSLITTIRLVRQNLFYLRNGARKNGKRTLTKLCSRQNFEKNLATKIEILPNPI